MKRVLYSFPLFTALFLSAVLATAQVATRTEQVSGFSSLDVSSAFEVELVQGSESKVVFEVDERHIDKANAKVKNGTLRIQTEGRIQNPKKLKVTVYFTDLDELKLSGATKVSAQGSLNFNDLSLKTSGATKIDLALMANKVELSTSGASTITLSGSAREFAIDLSGASKLNAIAFEVQNGTIKVAGASKADVFYTGQLDITATGASNVTYRGGASVGKINSSGASKIKGV